ncbi:helix-turn-helix domain-containing protein [Paenibacillus larvae]|uniref:LexA family protein n=1 Tax=Paenibacillus larvae TaxID=1464 RepID=UPI00227DF090|nr:XRE family transcriptional regulator [Paenibacillus larvae]MCY9700953.1 helix-turn-helix domain-containing protein [Paenibacillus larvae]
MDDKKIKEIFAANIKRLRKSRGMTQGDLAKILGVGISTVSDWEKAKKYPRAGVIEKLSQYFDMPKSSFFEVQGNAIEVYIEEDLVKIPIIGKVSCGNGVIAYEEIEGYEDTPSSWVRGADFFYLRAKGDSMINARIFDGDLVLIRKQNFVEEGEIAAVLIDDEVYLKRVYKHDDYLRLESENPTYKPIYKTKENCSEIKILGKLKKIVIDL